MQPTQWDLDQARLEPNAMSKSNESFSDQVATDMGCCALTLLWGMTAGLVTLVAKTLSTKPETQLRLLGQPSHWGTMTVEVACPSCGASNESGAKRCRICGHRITNTPTAWSDSAIKPATEDKTLNWIIIAVVFVLIMLCIAQVSNS